MQSDMDALFRPSGPYSLGTAVTDSGSLTLGIYTTGILGVRFEFFTAKLLTVKDS